MNKKSSFIQLVKYSLVGVLNTLLTGVVIWLMLRFVFGVKNDSNASHVVMSVSNVCGYVVGLINSFVLNRAWTFQSKADWKTGFLKFLLAFAVCYLIQLGVVLALNDMISSAYICQLAGIVTYTVLNFFFNKYYTFKK